MPVSKKQLLRIVRLVAQLKENRYPNCSKFASDMLKADLDENLNLACTSKTIYRDIQVLKKDFGAPIKFDARRNGYYLTRHDWNFSCPQIFDNVEMFSAVLGARVAEHIFPEPMKTQIRDAVDYLLTYNNPDFLNTTQMDSLVVIPANRTRINADIFIPLFEAWQHHEICHVIYNGSKSKVTERDFEPHTLIFFDGVWYTKGFCYKKQEQRTLVISRIRSVIPTGRYFVADPKIIDSATEEDLFDPETINDIVVVCDEYLANIIHTRPLHPDQEIIPLSTGGCEIKVKSMSRYRLITWIMHQCGQARITAPQAVIADIIRFSEQIFTMHKQRSSTGER